MKIKSKTNPIPPKKLISSGDSIDKKRNKIIILQKDKTQHNFIQ